MESTQTHYLVFNDLRFSILAAPSVSSRCFEMNSVVMIFGKRAMLGFHNGPHPCSKWVPK